MKGIEGEDGLNMVILLPSMVGNSSHFGGRFVAISEYNIHCVQNIIELIQSSMCGKGTVSDA